MQLLRGEGDSTSSLAMGMAGCVPNKCLTWGVCYVGNVVLLPPSLPPVCNNACPRAAQQSIFRCAFGPFPKRKAMPCMQIADAAHTHSGQNRKFFIGRPRCKI